MPSVWRHASVLCTGVVSHQAKLGTVRRSYLRSVTAVFTKRNYVQWTGSSGSLYPASAILLVGLTLQTIVSCTPRVKLYARSEASLFQIRPDGCEIAYFFFFFRFLVFELTTRVNMYWLLLDRTRTGFSNFQVRFLMVLFFFFSLPLPRRRVGAVVAGSLQ